MLQIRTGGGCFELLSQDDKNRLSKAAPLNIHRRILRNSMLQSRCCALLLCFRETPLGAGGGVTFVFSSDQHTLSWLCKKCKWTNKTVYSALTSNLLITRSLHEYTFENSYCLERNHWLQTVQGVFECVSILSYISYDINAVVEHTAFLYILLKYKYKWDMVVQF